MKNKISRLLVVVINIMGLLILLNMFLDSFAILPSYNRFFALVFVICIFSLPWFQDMSFLDRLASISGFILLFVFTSFDQANYLIIVLLFYILFKSFFFSKNSKEEVKDDSPTPIKKELNVKNKFNEVSSLILSFLNPFQLIQQILFIFGEMILSFKKDYLSVEDYEQKIDFELPLQGEWFVANGGSTKETSHSWDLKTQRFAYDFIKVDNEKKSYSSTGEELEDYYCYSEPVLSPADGKVIKVNDGIREHKSPGTMKMDFLARDFRGNFVIIKHQDQEYSFLAHMIPGSIKVEEGEKIKKGKEIGKCGNSGHSTEPHLHFQVQNHPNFYLGTSLPIKFSNIQANGKYYKDIYIKKGQRVKNDS
ncbi:M23 family metallopeptidase [Fuchsiella alkaliacetigena]|uniref:M23 family metallopeptidase n=1 Tax=Fuchsiella alkaliacetigena TaxID=957042 RepID=UPI00200B2292|nr:M23 family metallopeptidase [Fuchsiella alkaliacetigena]MCK8825487.1 M23 family metallopeptidase [Fuchsiella alkaliacetigena]